MFESVLSFLKDSFSPKQILFVVSSFFMIVLCLSYFQLLPHIEYGGYEISEFKWGIIVFFSISIVWSYGFKSMSLIYSLYSIVSDYMEKKERDQKEYLTIIRNLNFIGFEEIKFLSFAFGAKYYSDADGFIPPALTDSNYDVCMKLRSYGILLPVIENVGEGEIMIMSFGEKTRFKFNDLILNDDKPFSEMVYKVIVSRMTYPMDTGVSKQTWGILLGVFKSAGFVNNAEE